MLEDATSTESLDAIARKKELLLQRLQQRRPVKQAGSGTEKAKLREEELNEALNRAREQAERGVVDEQTVRTLEGFLSLEGCGWSAKRIQEALELLRQASLGVDSKDAQPSTFSFSISKKKPTPASPAKQSTVPASSKTESSLSSDEIPDNAIQLSNLHGENRVITGQDGFDVKLKDIRNCQLSFVFRPSTVHIQGVHDCKLVFLPVETSILVYDCTKSQIFATAQQLRIHNSHELRLHVGVRAAVIIESCNNIRMAPYRVIFNNENVETPPGDAWTRPNDFDWLAEGQSPNWTVAPESEWETHTLSEI
ncbi:tubulin binding cofactor [Teladorsagia circumcincta]|uniref:Tubulin binding cofactor n=1 Tax=Teladorsagia circumcincta TaxID=45464 RepID=A0A2G9UUJ0_TELCI|nr:tubulin binding cofactor [Teladorsagia circumcincta]